MSTVGNSYSRSQFSFVQKIKVCSVQLTISLSVHNYCLGSKLLLIGKFIGLGRCWFMIMVLAVPITVTVTAILQ